MYENLVHGNCKKLISQSYYQGCLATTIIARTDEIYLWWTLLYNTVCSFFVKFSALFLCCTGSTIWALNSQNWIYILYRSDTLLCGSTLCYLGSYLAYCVCILGDLLKLQILDFGTKLGVCYEPKNEFFCPFDPASFTGLLFFEIDQICIRYRRVSARAFWDENEFFLRFSCNLNRHYKPIVIIDLKILHSPVK